MIPAGIFPTLSQYRLLRLYTSIDCLSRSYQNDTKYFRYTAKGKRNFAIRLNQHGEFDEVFGAPPLLVLIAQIAPGMHAAVPVYRGYPNFIRFSQHSGYADVTSDAEIFRIVEECHRRGGIDIAGCDKFVTESPAS